MGMLGLSFFEEGDALRDRASVGQMERMGKKPSEKSS
jgi:hypothetical protein